MTDNRTTGPLRLAQAGLAGVCLLIALATAARSEDTKSAGTPAATGAVAAPAAPAVPVEPKAATAPAAAKSKAKPAAVKKTAQPASPKAGDAAAAPAPPPASAGATAPAAAAKVETAPAAAKGAAKPATADAPKATAKPTPAPAPKVDTPAKAAASPQPAVAAPKNESPAAAAARAAAAATAAAAAPASPAPAPAAPAATPPAGKGPQPSVPAAAAKPSPAPAAATPPAPAVAAKPATPAPSAEAEAVWRAYEKRWSETADYAASFRQTIEVPDIGSKVESAGRFYFAKPGHVRWEYTEGPPQTVVGDGTWIWLYQPDLQQVYKIPYAKAFGRGGLVELLAGREGVSERYSTALERPDAATVRIFLKSLAEGGGDLEVTLAADTFDLRAVTVHDAAGSTTSMTFAEPLRNRGVDKTRFTFTPPPGVDIISDNEAGF